MKQRLGIQHVRLLAAIVLLTVAGCDQGKPTGSKSHSEANAREFSPPEIDAGEARQAAKDFLEVGRAFFYAQGAPLPKDVQVRFTTSQADYEAVAREKQAEALTLNAVGVAFGYRHVVLAPACSRWLAWLMKERATLNGPPPAALMPHVDTGLHEFAHTIGQHDETHVARVLEESLAVEIASGFSVPFVQWVAPGSNPEQVDFEPSTTELDLDDAKPGDFVVTKAGGSYPYEIRFETLLFFVSHECDQAKDWETCALQHKVHVRLGRASATRAYAAICARENCDCRQYGAALASAIHSGDPVRLRWAVKEACGGEATPDSKIGCTSVQFGDLGGLGYAKLDLLVSNDYAPAVRVEKLENVTEGSVHRLSRPLRVDERLRTTTQPFYQAKFSFPDDPAEPCQLGMTPQFACRNLVLGFDSEWGATLVLTEYGRIYAERPLKPPVRADDVVDIPVLMGGGASVALGRHNVPSRLVRTGDTCRLELE